MQAFEETGHLLITAPAAARVKVDNVEVGRGPHSVGIELDGTAVYSTIQADAADSTLVKFTWVGTGEERKLRVTSLGVDALGASAPPAGSTELDTLDDVTRQPGVRLGAVAIAAGLAALAAGAAIAVRVSRRRRTRAGVPGAVAESKTRL